MINLKNKTIFTLFIFLILAFSFNVVYAGTSHAVIGYVEDSLDGTAADGAIVTMYVSTRTSETLTDTVGASGNSGTAKWYNIDIGNFPTPWSVGETVKIEIYKDASHEVDTSVILTSAGVDQASDTILPGSASTGTTNGGNSGGYSAFIIDFRTRNEYPVVYLSQVTPVTMILSDGKIFYVYYTITDNKVYLKITRSLQYTTQSFEEGNDLNKEILFRLNNINQVDVVDGSQKEVEIELTNIDPTKKFRFKELNETEELITPIEEQPEQPEQEPTTPIEKQSEKEAQPVAKPKPIVEFFKNNWKKILLTIILILLLIFIFEVLRKIFLIAKRKSEENKEKREFEKQQQTTIEKLKETSQLTTFKQEPKEEIIEKISEKKLKPFRFTSQPITKIKKPEPPKQESKQQIIQKPIQKQQEKLEPLKTKKQKSQQDSDLTKKFKSIFSRKKQTLNPEFLQKLKNIDRDEERLKEINKRIKSLDKKIK